MPARIRPSILLRIVGAAAVALVAVALVAGVALHLVVGGSAGAGAPGPRPGVDGTSPTALSGRKVVLDPGHNGGNGAAAGSINRRVPAGGFDKECDTVGAETDSGYPEHAFTFDVAGRAAAILRSRGASVILTRDNDSGVGPCIDERARIGNRTSADAVVSIHADGGPADGRGFHVIAPALSPDRANAPILAPSARLAAMVRSAFGRATGQPLADYLGEDGMTIRSDLGGLNLSRVPKVFLECGNMRNRTDAAELADPAWRARAAAGLVDGITSFLLGDEASSPGPG
ncbi:N-acetylmuramoyl-L-alanine amidase [Frankia casuarinae]|uniref:Cell wall hydrolase/autolysin n=1 Tax=Frankia casuarinae (strain DSM 45818 / CECT 9043 / HFP020203 / CcI3) TaxID=106370 RepID=Q2JDA8_FRACC|nr:MULTISPECIES: N-acetylmuramoyl-L-alanine amidase [Frankia]ABD10734.1 cell wall hydrolase/autolysin [Frankia casuarinae]ETA02080.1 N-acetylmuramoyl-L-alanine amidase [Frankia sp. CcI6]EYT93287.1 N-acetylmuramoyl-L-alanine amidase [Frankia casuarinae]KDA43962.1 N-acetylmuramoyl-L-alanine amidase [Frankia sp. BMG5.23]KFB04005.1 N-acetylmuramoyl-L-alanine amidase [Frankia sp. Allo2]